ncbi:uncharacterized protein LOC128250759 [Octopus bimaculoides]|uniref:Uncharacterized protein n=1 Tax=Octopus bimaculoides TaxID=37653 RepID=A0A0L8GT47_OCTBM|nr:uncharacterized protein LOC128250759 [Octopus bimaculoides]XP_052832550.1 uncharacterized protein LOC128250759 [Octopus bimaculoides]
MLKIKKINEENKMLAIDIPSKEHNMLISAKAFDEVSILGKVCNKGSTKKADKEQKITKLSLHHIITCTRTLVKGQYIDMFIDFVKEKCNDIQSMGLDRYRFLRNIKREMKHFLEYTKKNNEFVLQNLDWFHGQLFDIYTASNPYARKSITMPKPLLKFHPLSSVECRKLKFEVSGEDLPNFISHVVPTSGGIVTYTSHMMTICYATTDGSSNVVHCPSPITDMDRIGEDSVLATIPFKKKILVISPTSCNMKTLDYGFHKISYFKQSTFLGTELFGKIMYLIDWDDNQVKEKFSLKHIPTNIVVGPQYRILVTSANINTISCYDLDGRQLFHLSTQSTDIQIDLAVYQNYFYAVQGNIIYKISPTGAMSQRELKIKARYISLCTNNILLVDYAGVVHTTRTDSNFWPRFSNHQQECTPSLKDQIDIDDPYNIRKILPMSASSVLIVYEDLKVMLIIHEGQRFGKTFLTFKSKPSVFCRVDSNRFLVLFREDRKLQYITCPQLTEGHLIGVDSDYSQMCHIVSNKCLALTTSGNKAEVHILLIKEDNVETINRISLEHGDVVIAATPVNFVVADKREHRLLFFSSSGERLFKRLIDFNGYPHYIFADNLYFYVIFRRESMMTCYDITGEMKWQLKLPSNFSLDSAVFQGTAYVLDFLLSRVLLYKYHNASRCYSNFKNPYIRNLDIRLKENRKILIAGMYHLPNGQRVVSDINNNCLLYICNEGDIVATLYLPSVATDICQWDCNQIGVILPLEKQLRLIGNLSKKVRIVALSHPYVKVRKLGEGQIVCYCDKPSHLDIVSIENHNQGKVISTISIPFVLKSLAVENDTQNVLIVAKEKVFLYKTTTTTRRRRRGSRIKKKKRSMIPSVLLSQVKPPPNLFGGCIDNMFVYLIDNSRMFAINDHNLVVTDHVANKQLNMHIDLVDVFSRNICVSEMFSSTVHVEDLTVSDKPHYFVVPRCSRDKKQPMCKDLVITENNLIAIFDSSNANIKILTFDGHLVDSIKTNVIPRHMCRWHSNTLVITTQKHQLLTLKVNFPLILTSYRTKINYEYIASFSDNQLVCNRNNDKNTLFIIGIDEMSSTVNITKKINITKIVKNSHYNITDIAVTVNDDIIVNIGPLVIFFNRNGECFCSFSQYFDTQYDCMGIDDTYLYLYGFCDIYGYGTYNYIACLSLTGEYKKVFSKIRDYKHRINIEKLNCNGPRFVGHNHSYRRTSNLYVEGLLNVSRERFTVSRLLTNNCPVQVKDIDISTNGQTVVCEKANSGNVKIFDRRGELLCHRDLGTLVGGVCFTEERNIMVTVPNRQEIFQLSQQDLVLHKVWQSPAPYSAIWRKAGNIYCCVHTNLTEYYSIKIDGDQLKVLDYVSLLMIDSGLHFPSITSQMKKEIFSNELIDKLKYSEGGERKCKSGEIVGKGRLKARNGNYMAASMLGSDEITVWRMPYRTAMYPASIPPCDKPVDFNDLRKLIMLDANIAVFMLIDTVIVITTTGNVLQHKQLQKKPSPKDICQWTDEHFIVTSGKQLTFFNRNLSLLKTISTEKYYNRIYKKNDNQLLCAFSTDVYNPSVEFSSLDIVEIHGDTCKHIRRVCSGKYVMTAIGVTSSEDIVVVTKGNGYTVCFYREHLVRRLKINIEVEPDLTIHGENVYVTDAENDIYQVSVDSIQETFEDEDEDQIFEESVDHISVESEDQISAESEDQIFEESEDQLSVESEDQIFEESEDQLSVESEDQIFEESEDQLSVESEDQIFEESEDQLSVESEDQIFEESEDQLSVESEDQIFEESEDQLSEESEDQIFVESEDQISVESEDQIPDNKPHLFLSGDDVEAINVLGLAVSDSSVVIFGPVHGNQSYCFFHYER